MVTILTLLSVVYFLALVVMVVEMATAPAGYEDEHGFHLGDEPATELELQIAALSADEMEPVPLRIVA